MAASRICLVSDTRPPSDIVLTPFQGRKAVFLSALALLSVSELLCGFSQNATMLYVFRGLAGVANGGVMSLSMMIVSDIITLKERGKFQGILGSFVGAGNMAGPFIAASFIQHSTWRGLFWLVSPLAASCGIIGYLIIPTPKNSPRLEFRTVSRQIDYYGILTGAIAIVLLLIPISGGGTYFNWNSPMVISMLIIGAAFLVAFLYVEHRVALLPMMPRKSPCPLPKATPDTISITLQKCGRLYHVDPKLSLRRGVLLSTVLPTLVLSECTPNVPDHSSYAFVTSDRRPNAMLNLRRTVHIQNGALR
jgi:MFS family permease